VAEVIPRAELDVLQAENRRLRREAGDVEALNGRSPRRKTCTPVVLREGSDAGDGAADDERLHVMSSPTMPSSGSRLTSGQQISARSQYGPTTGTTSSSTNRRTVMKCSHCSSVNCSRTEKKSVPRDSPRRALVTCVIAGFPPR